jgi:hypothetical protein
VLNRVRDILGLIKLAALTAVDLIKPTRPEYRI